MKLTYKPSEEELEVSRKQQESLVAHQKQVQSTSSSGTDRVAVVTTATDGTTSTTTLATAPTATRLSPLSHEVTSTTEGDEEVTFTVRNCVTRTLIPDCSTGHRREQIGLKFRFSDLHCNSPKIGHVTKHHDTLKQTCQCGCSPIQRAS